MKMFSVNVDKEIKEYFFKQPTHILNTTQRILVTAHSDVDQMLKGTQSEILKKKSES